MTRKYSRKRSRTRRIRPKRSKRTRTTKRPRTKRMRTKRHSKQLGGMPGCLQCGTRRKPAGRRPAPISVAQPTRSTPSAARALSQRAEEEAAAARKASPEYGLSAPGSRNKWARADPQRLWTPHAISAKHGMFPTVRAGKTTATRGAQQILPAGEMKYLLPTGQRDHR